MAAAAREMRRTFGVDLTSIGVITERRDLVLADPGDTDRPLVPSGWDPFA
jgi:hypothetical protein